MMMRMMMMMIMMMMMAMMMMMVMVDGVATPRALLQHASEPSPLLPFLFTKEIEAALERHVPFKS